MFVTRDRYVSQARLRLRLFRAPHPSPTRSKHADANDTARLRALSRYDRVGPRLLGDAAQLGALDPALRGEGLPRPRPRIPRFRGRGRGAQRRPNAGRAAHGPGGHRASGVDRRGARRPSDPHGPLGGRHVCADPARPRLRRCGSDVQLRADRGRPRRAVVADPGDVPGAQEPGEPAPGGRPHVRAVALHLHQHFPRGRGACPVQAISRARVGRHSMGQRAREPRARAAGDLGQLPQRGAAPAAVHLRR